MTRLERTRADLAAFLRTRRERIRPESVGLPRGRRRRTPGLRREEVAALAGVGLTWYTWLEQGRQISVSTTLLDSLSRVLQLDAVEHRHLYLLVHQRPPAEEGKTWCVVPPLVYRLLSDLPQRPAYVLNLHWDVLAWNDSADSVFGFSEQAPEYRNLLWMLFMHSSTRELFHHWEQQAQQMLSSFRRDFTRAGKDEGLHAWVKKLEKASPEFRVWWREHQVHAPCQGTRLLNIPSLGLVEFEHITLVIDEERHVRLVYYAATAGQAEQQFERLHQLGR